MFEGLGLECSHYLACGLSELGIEFPELVSAFERMVVSGPGV